MILSVHQPHYLPWLGYFDKIERSDIFVVLDNVQYKKREYQNRNRIKTPGGALWLTVPVLTGGKYEQKTGEVRIDNTSGWRAKHLKAVELNYGRAEHFERLYPAVAAFYTGGAHELLAELCVEMLRYFMNELGIGTRIVMESALGAAGTKTERIKNICLALGADTYLSGAGAREYLDEALLREAGLELEYQDFRHPEYPQLHGDFMPYMSVIDLLFNCGDRSAGIIRSGREKA